MSNQILQDNQMYLLEWSKYQDDFAHSLTIINKDLFYQDEKIDISNFYFQELLYNRFLREKIYQEKMSGKQLFDIIKLYVQTKEIIEYDKNTPYIIDYEIKRKENETFIVFIDELNQKYRFDTTNIDNAISVFLSLKRRKNYFTINDLREEIKNAIV